MLAHSFDRFYVVTKFILPMMDDLKLSLINYDKDCKYLNYLDDDDDDDDDDGDDDDDDEQIKTNIKDLITYCTKLRPCMAFYKMQISACNKTAHHILKNEVDLFLKQVDFLWNRKVVVVVDNLSSTSEKINLLQELINRMRNIHQSRLNFTKIS